MGKHTSIEIQELIIRLYKNGIKPKDIAKQTNKPLTTIYNILSRHNNYRNKIRKENCGRKAKLTTKEKSIIGRELIKTPKKSCMEISNEIKNQYNKKVSKTTIWRAIKEIGFKSFIPRKKPFLSNNQIEKRLNFAKEFFCKSIQYWRKIVWSDECIFKVNNSSNQKKYWIKQTNEYQLPLSITTSQTKKYNKKTIMVWACFSYYGKGNLIFIDDIINALRYQQILSENLIESVNNMNLNTFIFQQDNAPSHSSKLLKQFFNKNNIELLPFPPQSPDLNPIENLWAYISSKLIEKSPKTINDLKNEILNIWNSLDNNKLRKLANSLPNRLRQVIESNGKHINY